MPRNIIDTLRDLLSFAPGDRIYDVREREGLGWDGPRVKLYAQVIREIEEFTNETESEAVALLRAKGEEP